MNRKHANLEGKFGQKLRPAASCMLEIVGAAFAGKSRNRHPSRRRSGVKNAVSAPATAGQ